MPIDITTFKRVVFFTGAGMSAESGVPTYRGAGGIWKNYNYQEYACQAAFEKDPAGVWRFHNYRRELVGGCAPNEGHRLIALCEAQLAQVTVITQNIDGLHQKAGSRAVIELHGSLWRVRNEFNGDVEENFDIPFEGEMADGRWWRPDITWFGDSLNEHAIRQAVSAIQECDCFISIGTSAVVYPAARLPYYAVDAGATCMEINPESTPLSSVYQHCIRSSATDALGEICHALDAD